MVQCESFDQRRDKGPRILVGCWLPGELHETRELHECAFRCAQLEQRSKARLPEPGIRRGTPAMVDNDAQAWIDEERHACVRVGRARPGCRQTYRAPRAF